MQYAIFICYLNKFTYCYIKVIGWQNPLDCYIIIDWGYKLPDQAQNEVEESTEQHRTAKNSYEKM